MPDTPTNLNHATRTCREECTKEEKGGRLRAKARPFKPPAGSNHNATATKTSGLIKSPGKEKGSRLQAKARPFTPAEAGETSAKSQLTKSAKEESSRASVINRPKRTVQFRGTIHPTRTAAKSTVRQLPTHAKTDYIGRFYTSLDFRRFKCDQDNSATYLSMDGFTFGKHERKRTGADEANRMWREHTTMCSSRVIDPTAAILNSSPHQREQQQPTVAPQHPLPGPRATAPAERTKTAAVPLPTPKATAPADSGKAETPEATSSPAEHVTLSGRRHWVVRVRGDGNCLFRSVSKAVNHGNDRSHMSMRRAACQ